MKANELMIGDWIECTYWTPSKRLRVAEIRRIIDDEIKIGVYSDDLVLIFRQSEVKPIPLTTEIIEKNGFKYKEGETGMYGVTIAPHYICDGVPFEVFCDGEPFSIWFKDPVNIAFVHQLQHALRLCGIEKTIEL